MSRYFHGGMPGLSVGDEIVPGHKNYVDGCAICADLKAGRDTPFDARNVHPENVFVTTDREYARFYASKYPRGDLYVVRPVGDLQPSPEDHFETWHCASAVVLSVYARFVQLTTRQRQTMLNRWKRADRAVDLARRAEVP